MHLLYAWFCLISIHQCLAFMLCTCGDYNKEYENIMKSSAIMSWTTPMTSSHDRSSLCEGKKMQNRCKVCVLSNEGNDRLRVGDLSFLFLRSVFLRLPGPAMRPTNEIFTSAADYCEVTTNYRRALGCAPGRVT